MAIDYIGAEDVAAMTTMVWIFAALGGFIFLVVVYDLVQHEHTILRNFPLIGHFRYILESIGPELRQYIVTDNDSERPFNRDQRRWVYASAKQENNYFGFGTDNSIELLPNYLVMKHSTFPYHGAEHNPNDHPSLPCCKVWGAARGRKKAFRPDTSVYISAMSFGSLSAAAIESLNRGADLVDCLHNTGEGSISPYHDSGGDLIWQIGTGYFGCRDRAGNFNMDDLLARVDRYPVRALEIKLSQGAKPGHGGVLPGGKVTDEIAKIRGIPAGEDCISPAGHSAFDTTDEMLDFVESLADATGLPIGIKSAVGDMGFWTELADLMETDERGVDFITIDGGEGGTGAAPLAFADHVALPFKTAFPRVYRIFARRGMTDDIVFNGSGKLGFPQSALFAFAMGCDTIAVAREAMLSIGCIQAQRCHTGNCPAGVATQNDWLMHGLDPTLKSARFANYLVTLQSEVLDLAHACGVAHPSLVTLDDFEVLDENFDAHSAQALFDYVDGWGLPPESQRAKLQPDAAPQSAGLAEPSAAE